MSSAPQAFTSKASTCTGSGSSCSSTRLTRSRSCDTPSQAMPTRSSVQLAAAETCGRHGVALHHAARNQVLPQTSAAQPARRSSQAASQTRRGEGWTQCPRGGTSCACESRTRRANKGSGVPLNNCHGVWGGEGRPPHSSAQLHERATFQLKHRAPRAHGPRTRSAHTRTHDAHTTHRARPGTNRPVPDPPLWRVTRFGSRCCVCVNGWVSGWAGVKRCVCLLCCVRGWLSWRLGRRCCKTWGRTET
jgi:hypothetical protein